MQEAGTGIIRPKQIETEEAVVEFPDNETSVERKKYFFDVGINDEDQGRIIFELANDLVQLGLRIF